MKLVVQESQMQDHPENFLRKTAGYAHINSYHTGHDSYVYRLTNGHYPRFHVYVKQEGDRVIFDLHLDQKQTSYGGSHAHNAEYDSPVVMREIERLKSFLAYNKPQTPKVGVGQSKEFQRIGHGEYDKNIQPREKKSWWKRLFG